MDTPREQMGTVNAYEVGSCAAAAVLQKTTHKTEKRAVERRARGQTTPGRGRRTRRQTHYPVQRVQVTT